MVRLWITDEALVLSCHGYSTLAIDTVVKSSVSQGYPMRTDRPFSAVLEIVSTNLFEP